MERSADAASRRADMPEGSGKILNTRALRTAYRRLAEILRPGMTVLDVGCGTGAITRGMAEAVAPDGHVVGIDVNRGLIDEARRTHGHVSGLAFEVCDAYRLPYQHTFDVVTAARCLQWLADPLGALRGMAAALKPGGRMAVLDYNHERIAWAPPPPQSMQTFYAAFLRWRADAGLDNAIADHLHGLLDAVGLVDVRDTPQHEETHRTDPDFVTRISLWAEVAAGRGHQMVADGIISAAQRVTAEADYRAWIREGAESQTLYLISTEGRRPQTCRHS